MLFSWFLLPSMHKYCAESIWWNKVHQLVKSSSLIDSMLHCTSGSELLSLISLPIKCHPIFNLCEELWPDVCFQTSLCQTNHTVGIRLTHEPRQESAIRRNVRRPKVSQHLLGLPNWIVRPGTGRQVCLWGTRQCGMLSLTTLYKQTCGVKDWK